MQIKKLITENIVQGHGPVAFFGRKYHSFTISLPTAIVQLCLI